MGKLIDKSEFWLIKDNPITKTGVFPYLGAQIGQQGLDAEKIYYVLRPAEELFKPETVESFNGIPITIEHAMLGSQDKGLTKPEDKGIDGVTLESAHAQGDKLLNNIRLFSEQIKDAVNSGKKELSAGYYCDFVPESGDYHGQHYDFVQRNIFGNHIALVDKGRSGSEIRVMDSAIKSRMVFDSMDLGTFTQDFNKNHDPKNGQFTFNGTNTSGKQESDKTSSVQPISITGDELGSYTDIKDLRTKAIQWYKDNLQGNYAENPKLGKILFSRKGMNEFETYSANPNKLKMVVALKKILDTSVDVKTEDLHKERKDGAVRFHRVAGAVKIGNSPLTKIKVLVWEDVQGNKFYDLELPKK